VKAMMEPLAEGKFPTAAVFNTISSALTPLLVIKTEARSKIKVARLVTFFLLYNIGIPED
jgi:hypothetical protein